MKPQTHIYGAGGHLLIVVGLASAFFCGLFLLVFLKTGQWMPLTLACAGSLVGFLLLRTLRLELSPSWFKYRNLSGAHTVVYSQIADAYFDVVRRSQAPQGVSRFWIALRQGQHVKVNLRTFPVEAAARLFTAIEAQGVEVRVPDEWAARRVADQVRAAQAKLGRGD